MTTQVFDQAVLEFVTEFGATASYISVNEGDYDPNTGIVLKTETAYTARAILLDLTLQSNGLTTKYGGMIQAGDKQILMQPPHKLSGTLPTLVVNPAVDKIIFAGVAYKIISFKEVNPTGADSILFDFYVRR